MIRRFHHPSPFNFQHRRFVTVSCSSLLSRTPSSSATQNIFPFHNMSAIVSQHSSSKRLIIFSPSRPTRFNSTNNDHHDPPILSRSHPSVSPFFIKTLHCILYKLSTTPNSSVVFSHHQASTSGVHGGHGHGGRSVASPSRPQWVPLGVLSAHLPEALVEREHLDQVNGGLRGVIEETPSLSESCELERNPTTGMWLARTKPIFAVPSSSSSASSGLLSSSSHEVQLFAPQTFLLAKFAAKVSEQLLKIAKEEELELDDDQQLNASEKVFVTVSNLENLIDHKLQKKLIEQYQHLNIALVEAEKWIPEAALCWTLELRQVDKKASWSQSVVALKRGNQQDQNNNDVKNDDDGSVDGANQSLEILKSISSTMKKIGASSDSFSTDAEELNSNSATSSKRGGGSNRGGSSMLSADDLVGSVGGVPLPPPPLQGGGVGYHYVDPKSLEYNNGLSSNRPSYLDELDGEDFGNFSSGIRITPDTSIDIDVSLIPPAPTPEQIAHDYERRAQESTLSKGQVYNAPNATTSQELKGVALTIEDLMGFVPSFFIPVELALEHLQPLGYTQAHIDDYFSSIRSVQVIKSSWPSFPSAASPTPSSSAIQNGDNASSNSSQQPPPERQFIRIFAGGGKFDMSPILATNKRFARFEPLPALSRPFLKILTKPGQWMPIRDLLELAGKEAEESLPFRGSDALLYFAQLQQIFVFSVERGGIVARRPASQNFSLFSSTTPCPVFYNQLCRVIERNLHGAGRNRLHVDAVPQLIQEKEVLEEMQRCFPNWQAFAAAHREKFMFDANTNELMLTSAYEAEQRHQLPLEEQLEHAIRTRNIANIKTLKRRIATTSNPDNPLLDPERLAAAIAEFLPPSHHVKVASLLKSLPDEMRDLLPRAGLQRFLKRFPVYFTCFDYKQAGVRHVQRTGLSLPSGALRNDFSKEEIVALCVQELQRKDRGRMNVANLLLKMPGSVIENLKRGAALAGILKEYSDCFVFVSSAGTVDVIMVKPPSFVAATSNMDTAVNSDGGSRHQHYHQVEGQEGTDDEWVAMAKESFRQQ